MISEVNLIFAGISAFCALGSLIFAKLANDNKKESQTNKDETQRIKDELENYRIKTQGKNDLISLKSIIEPLKKLSDELCRFNTKKLPQEGNTKEILDYYGEHFETLNRLSFDIPEKYKEAKDKLNYLKKGYNICIQNKQTFDSLDKSIQINYMSMNDNYSNLIDNINTITSDLLI